MAKPLPKSHYVGPGAAQAIVSRTLSVLVDNEPGVLARVIGLFSGRGYNIDSLTVTETEHEKHLSRITIVTSGTPDVIEQIKHQLERLVPVHRVRDLTVEADALERELALIKVSGKGEKRIEALRIAEIFRAQVVDTSTEHFVFELTGKPSKLEQFIQIMTELGLVEVSRTGIAAIGRGPRAFKGAARIHRRPSQAGPTKPPAASAATPQPHKYDREEQRKPCAFITIVMPTSISSRPRRSRSSATAAKVTRTR